MKLGFGHECQMADPSGRSVIISTKTKNYFVVKALQRRLAIKLGPRGGFAVTGGYAGVDEAGVGGRQLWLPPVSTTG